MICTPSSPLSTNQINEVGILKAKCMDFPGNALNDWLKFFAENTCRIDWDKIDFSCIEENLDLNNSECCGEKRVFDLITKSICYLNSKVETLETTAFQAEKVYILVPTGPWVNPSTQPLRALRIGNRVFLQGKLTEGAASNTTLLQLPEEVRPSQNLRVSVAHEFTISTDYLMAVNINTTGLVQISFVGASPSGSGAVYLDGISFFIN